LREDLLESASAQLENLARELSAAIASFFGGAGAREAAKQALLAELVGLDRGAKASAEQQEAVEAAARALERCVPRASVARCVSRVTLCRLNPNLRALSCSAINGRWELVYTTSVSILGSNRPALFRPAGPIYQTIDVERKRAKNQETAPFFSSVTAALTPTSPSAVAVQFKTFRLFGFVAVTAPDAARGALDTTYVDEELRVSRGDKGNLFVLLQRDPEARLDDAAWEASFALAPVPLVSDSVRDFR